MAAVQIRLLNSYDNTARRRLRDLWRARRIPDRCGEEFSLPDCGSLIIELRGQHDEIIEAFQAPVMCTAVSIRYVGKPAHYREN